MTSKSYPAVDALLNTLSANLQAIFGQKLIGLYLYGSVVTGDYDPNISDVDLLAATASDIDENDFPKLDAMHHEIVARDPQWDNRIEIAYLSLDGLKTFRTKRSPLGIISPGEPFHMIDAGDDWLMNWYLVLTYGKTIYGVPPQTIIDPISTAEFIHAIIEHVRAARPWIEKAVDRGTQAYIILTLCRALYTITHGEHPSKRKAAEWAASEMPEWLSLIHDALAWRQVQNVSDESIDHEATLPETRRFADFMIERILSDKRSTSYNL